MVSESGSILVIDDHPKIRAGLVRLVEELGYAAVEADSSTAGMGAAKISFRRKRRNPLKRFDSNERIQGNPRKSNSC